MGLAKNLVQKAINIIIIKKGELLSCVSNELDHVESRWINLEYVDILNWILIFNLDMMLWI